MLSVYSSQDNRPNSTTPMQKLQPQQQKGYYNYQRSPLRKRIATNIPDYYKKSKVDTCSNIFIKNGQAIAVGYYDPNQSPDRVLKQKKIESRELKSQLSSINQQSYQQKFFTHVGAKYKPMEPYKANAQRNRLLSENGCKHDRLNQSNIEIYDRINPYKRTFVTSNQIYYGKYKSDRNTKLMTNIGIASEQAKWMHFLQNI